VRVAQATIERGAKLSGEAGTREMQLRGIEKKHGTVVVNLIALTDSAVSPITLKADHTLIMRLADGRKSR